MRQRKAQLPRAAQFRMSCLQRSKRSFLRKRWKRQYLPMTSRQREENIRQITEQDWKRLSQKKKSGLQFLARLFTSIRRRPSEDDDHKDHKRPDGRRITQIRPLAAEIDILPRVHGSAMFTRGQTQICKCLHTGSAFRGTEVLTDWMRMRQPRDICIITTSRPTP